MVSGDPPKNCCCYFYPQVGPWKPYTELPTNPYPITYPINIPYYNIDELKKSWQCLSCRINYAPHIDKCECTKIK